jgi:glyoxylase-like metal-dependent hydrolase (beta-lactamase superfamily II)
MTQKPHGGLLRYPFPKPPPKKDVIEIAEGVLWLRLPLPFRLDHINIYLIDDGDGWAVLDTGIASAATKELWSALISGPLRGRKLTRLIATHYHPDHIGLAGWFAERHGLPLFTTECTYLQCLAIALRPPGFHAETYRDFYLRNGLSAEIAALLGVQGQGYLKLVTPLPPTFERIAAGDLLRIGGRDFEVLTSDGHAAEQAMLYCPEDKLFFPADQVLDKISPNISVWPSEPNGDPLGRYLRSLKELKATLPDDVTVLPSHHLPFIGLHVRADQLAEHHERRCTALLKAARAPKFPAELIHSLFHRALDEHETIFAFGEVLAHVNYLLRDGRLIPAEPKDGVNRVQARR